MAFAFTTSPANRPEETAARFITNNPKTSEVRALSAARPSEVEGTAVSVIPVNEQALLASRDDAPTADTTNATDAAIASTPAQGAAQPPASSGLVSADTIVATAAAEAARDDAGDDGERVVAAAMTAPAGTTPPLGVGDRIQATLSFYYCERGERGLHPGDGGNFCGVMRDGDVVYPGAAACAYVYLGQRFRIEGDPTERTYTCADTGSAVHGLHRDIWFMDSDEGWSWQLDVGQVAIIEIVE